MSKKILKTEYFLAYHGSPDDALIAAKNKRDIFLTNFEERIEYIDSENIQVHGAGTSSWCIIIKLSYYAK